MNFVDEQHVMFAKFGEDCGKVAGTFERGARSDVQFCTHLFGDDACHGGFT